MEIEKEIREMEEKILHMEESL